MREKTQNGKVHTDFGLRSWRSTSIHCDNTTGSITEELVVIQAKNSLKNTFWAPLVSQDTFRPEGLSATEVTTTIVIIALCFYNDYTITSSIKAGQVNGFFKSLKVKKYFQPISQQLNIINNWLSKEFSLQKTINLTDIKLIFIIFSLRLPQRRLFF